MTHVLAELFFVVAGLIGVLVMLSSLRTAASWLDPHRDAASAVIVVERRHPRLRTGGQSRARRKRGAVEIGTRAA